MLGLQCYWNEWIETQQVRLRLGRQVITTANTSLMHCFECQKLRNANKPNHNIGMGLSQKLTPSLIVYFECQLHRNKKCS